MVATIYDYDTARRLALAVNRAPHDRHIDQQPRTAGNDTPDQHARRQPRKMWWRWTWAFGVALLILVGLAYPYFGVWDRTEQWRERYGLDGETWLGRSVLRR